jgi:hypothetical protein
MVSVVLQMDKVLLLNPQLIYVVRAQLLASLVLVRGIGLAKALMAAPRLVAALKKLRLPVLGLVILGALV